MNKRFLELYSKMVQKKINGFIINNKINWRYLCGFTGSTGILIATPAENILIIDGRYTEQAMAQTTDVTIHTLKSKETLWEAAGKILLNIPSIGIEVDSISCGEFLILTKFIKKENLIQTKNIVESLRMIKSPEELVNMEQVALLADKTFSYILNIIKPGMTELELANEIDYYSKKIGSQGPAFETIVASGKRTALPHAHASDKIIQNNELIMLDFGCIVSGYYSDMTRTFSLGEVDEKIQEDYSLLLKTQKLAIEKLQVGTKLSAFDQLSRDYLSNFNKEKYFTHGLGHGIGLSCHEFPYLNLTEDTLLQQNMVFTVEPGIYFNGNYGIRIEDDIYIDEQGQSHTLTKSNKEWMKI